MIERGWDIERIHWWMGWLGWLCIWSWTALAIVIAGDYADQRMKALADRWRERRERLDGPRGR